ncbi:hypothetical protein T190_32245 [Sinorhizobium meliloti CCBAU 01290]|nr:hypothetical protein T190_32245 [Sinorhizobium meliloti CCBAU 01290]
MIARQTVGKRFQAVEVAGDENEIVTPARQTFSVNRADAR